MVGARTFSCRTPWFARGVAMTCLLATCVAAMASEPIILTTRSKQFTVRGRLQTSTFATARPDLIYADPALLSLVCERVREALQQELGWSDRWRDPVFVNIHQTRGRQQRPYIQAIPQGAKGWRYRIEMPDEVTRREFIEPLIEVLLLEYANHGAHDESVELPPWLIDGITEDLLHGPLAGLTLHVNTMNAGPSSTFTPLKPYSYTVRERTNENAMPVLRARVQAQGALTVDQLNWPEYDENDRVAEAAYRMSAHLFVRELLRLRGGADALSATLALLPESLNWQTAFLRAFDAHFTRMLDVEKWWSLVIVKAKGRETSVLWSARESQSRLEDILYTPMQVRLTRDELPHVAPVELQTLINEGSFPEQKPILRNKVNQLSAMRVRVPKEFHSITDDYRAALENYLNIRSSKKMVDRDPSSRQVRALVSNVITSLTALDKRRNQLRTQVLTAADTDGVAPLTPQ